MYDIVIVGAGIAGLNTARLLQNKNKKICILEKSSRIGGLINTKYINLKTRKIKLKKNNRSHKKQSNYKTNKIKFEAGGAVVYDYQKNMVDLIKKFDVDVRTMPIDNTTLINRHYKDFWDGKPRKKPLGKESVNRFFILIKKVFDYIDKKGDNYCRKLTLEQIALEVLTFNEVRFIEFCYGYSAEFRIANSVVAKKNIENELFNSSKILVFVKGYSCIINSIYNSIKNNVILTKNCNVRNFKEEKGYIKLITNKGIVKCKKVIFAVPREALIHMCDSFTQAELSLFNKVQPFSLNRIFAQYNMKNKNNKWMENIKFSTVDNPIRQIIPLRKKMGLFQISYSDWYFADYWGNLTIDNAKRALKKLLTETFHFEKIDDPIKFIKCYWKNACHYWLPNHNEKTMYKRIQHLRKNIFIIGESFSLNQGWAEGALQTSIDVSNLISESS